jgi:hypothetical protein
MMRAVHAYALCTLCALLSGCEQVTQLDVSPRVAGTLGSVTTEPAPDNRTRLIVLVQRMARPADIVPPASAYVVWVRDLASTAAPTKIGALVILENGTGRLDAYVALKALELFVTPESTLLVTAPEHAPILRATVLAS